MEEIKTIDELIEDAKFGPRQWPKHKFHLDSFGRQNLKSAREIAQKSNRSFDETKAKEIVIENIEKAENAVSRWIKSTYFLVNEINGYETSKKNALEEYDSRINSLNYCVKELKSEGVDISELKSQLKSIDKKILQLSNPKLNKNYTTVIMKKVITVGLLSLLSFGIGYSISKNQLEKKLEHYEQIFQERNQNDFEAYVNDSLLEPIYKGKERK